MAVLLFKQSIQLGFRLTIPGAVRLEHQFYALGQACANACDIALKTGTSVQKVSYQQLNSRLLDQGVVLDISKVGVPEFPNQ